MLDGHVYSWNKWPTGANKNTCRCAVLLLHVSRFFFYREGDLLVEVNGKPLLDRKQKRIIKIFQKIKPKQHDGNFYITLVGGCITAPNDYYYQIEH